jgi:hypothetical protein
MQKRRTVASNVFKQSSRLRLRDLATYKSYIRRRLVGRVHCFTQLYRFVHESQADEATLRNVRDDCACRGLG